MIPRYVTHISDELEPNKGVCCGHIVHVLFITKYVYVVRTHGFDVYSLL